MTTSTTRKSRHIHSMIVYAKYVTEGDGKQCVAISFIKLIELPQCTAKDLYTKLCNILNEYELPKNKICGVPTHGASIMTGIRFVFTTHRKKDAPQCIEIHCIAHRLSVVSYRQQIKHNIY